MSHQKEIEFTSIILPGTQHLFPTVMKQRQRNPIDPLDEVLKPPPDETEQERIERLEREENAKRVSNAIDESIRAERLVMKKRKVVRLLLLGQSESGMFYNLFCLMLDFNNFILGKSTTLRRGCQRVPTLIHNLTLHIHRLPTIIHTKRVSRRAYPLASSMHSTFLYRPGY